MNNLGLSGLGSRNAISVGPRAKLRINSSDQDDENSILLSGPFEFRHYYGALEERTGATTPLVESIALVGGPTIESDRNFDNTNLVADGQFNVNFPTLGKANRRGTFSGYAIDIQPYGGVEVGKNLENRIATLDGRSIFRLKVGFAGQVRLNFKKTRRYKIVFDVEYVHRRLYAEEALSRSVTIPLPVGTLTPVEGEPLKIDAGFLSRMSIDTINKGPRSYLHVAIRYAFDPNWEFFASYVNGELPPRFVSVHKFQAGFAYRFKSQY